MVPYFVVTAKIGILQRLYDTRADIKITFIRGLYSRFCDLSIDSAFTAVKDMQSSKIGV